MLVNGLRAKFLSFLSPSTSLTVTDTDVPPEVRTRRTAQPLIWVFAVSLGDLSRMSLTQGLFFQLIIDSSVGC